MGWVMIWISDLDIGIWYTDIWTISAFLMKLDLGDRFELGFGFGYYDMNCTELLGRY